MWEVLWKVQRSQCPSKPSIPQRPCAKKGALLSSGHFNLQVPGLTNSPAARIQGKEHEATFPKIIIMKSLLEKHTAQGLSADAAGSGKQTHPPNFALISCFALTGLDIEMSMSMSVRTKHVRGAELGG